MNDNINLSGVLTSNLSSVDIEHTDLLLVSEPALKKNTSKQYLSKHVDFDTLQNQILNNLRDFQKFGSMSVEDTKDYSPINHTHDYYNKVCGISSLLSGSDNTIYIGKIIVDGIETNIFAPNVRIKKTPSPILGQLKFVHHTTTHTIDIMSDDFDGWVYADGSQYKINQFDKQVSSVFDNDGEYFFVPYMNSFIKPNPTPYNQNNLESIYNHVDPIHSHNAVINLSGNVNGSLYYRYGAPGDGNTSHGASTAIRNMNYTVQLDYSNVRIASTSKNYIKPSQTELQETYPSHVNIPTVVYIGKPIRLF